MCSQSCVTITAVSCRACFVPEKETPYALAAPRPPQLPPSPLKPPPRRITSLLPVSVPLPLLDVSCKRHHARGLLRLVPCFQSSARHSCWWPSTAPLYGCALLFIQRQVRGIWAARASGLPWTLAYKSSCGRVLLLLGTFLGWGLLGLR